MVDGRQPARDAAARDDDRDGWPLSPSRHRWLPVRSAGCRYAIVRVELPLRPVLAHRRHLADAVVGAAFARAHVLVASSGLCAIGGPMSPWPARPWHLAQTPIEGLLAEREQGVPLAYAPRRRTRPRGRTSTWAIIAACWRPQNSAHWPVKVPSFVGAEGQVVRLAGDRVDLPAERGDPPAVVDVVASDLAAGRRGCTGAAGCRSRWRRSGRRSPSSTGGPRPGSARRRSRPAGTRVSSMSASCRRRSRR